jgi:GNAT superfamily N-acetyltransferase
MGPRSVRPRAALAFVTFVVAIFGAISTAAAGTVCAEITIHNNTGSLYVHRGAREIRLMDIALLPVWRRRGIGGELVQALLTEAETANKSVTLHVEPGNPARCFYLRAGFHHDCPSAVFPVWRRLKRSLAYPHATQVYCTVRWRCALPHTAQRRVRCGCTSSIRHDREPLRTLKALPFG